MFIETAGGGITIEREVGRPPKITMDDGTVLGDTDFQLLIGGVTGATRNAGPNMYSSAISRAAVSCGKSMTNGRMKVPAFRVTSPAME